MKFITAEQFSEADKNVRDSIMEWWEPGVYDLAHNTVHWVKGSITSVEFNKLKIGDCSSIFHKAEVIPLLTVGQLIEFVEWKTDSMVDIVRDFDVKDKGRSFIQCYSRDIETLDDGVTYFIAEYESAGHNILNALWEVVQRVCE